MIFVLYSCKKDKDLKRDDEGQLLDIQLEGSLQNPAFSPDGKSMVFTLFRNGYNKEPADIYLYNFENENLTLLVSDGSGNVNLPGSSWNSDCNSIVFSSSREPHDEIYIISATGIPGKEQKITSRADFMAYEPSFNDDGNWVVFESHETDKEDNGIIMKYRVDGSSDYIALTDADDDCRQPNWSPKGDKILYQKFENGQWDIWTMNTDGSDKLKVTSGSGDKTDAVFYYNGDYIVYSSDFETDNANLYKIPLTGGTAVRLTYYNGYDGAPSVSPDGTKLIFESCSGNPDKSDGTKLILLVL